MRTHTPKSIWFALALSLPLGACSSQSSAPEPAPAEDGTHTEHDEHAGHDHAAEPGAAMEQPAVPAGAKVFFVEPADGASVRGEVQDGKVAVAVKMGAEGIAVEPAGPPKEGSGHHHILIDTDGLAMGTVVPADDRHVHFGKAQTEASLPLSPGKHRLTLQFADGLHRSYGESMTSSIEITVLPEGTPKGAAENPEEQARELEE